MSTRFKTLRMIGVCVAALGAMTLLQSKAVRAEPLGYATSPGHPAFLFGQTAREPEPADEVQTPADIPARLHRHIVDYSTREAPGTIVIDTPNTYLYYVVGGGKAIRYGIGVGREGFTWSGVKAVERKAEWPDWIPPAEMLQRQPYLPRFMAGGPGQSARRTRHVHWRHGLSHSRNERPDHDRQASVERMHPHAE